MTKRHLTHKSSAHPSLERSPGNKDNWVEKVGGLPSYIERIAKHIHYDSGLSISHSIAAAVERVKVLAAKGNPQAVAALAQWNAKKAKTKAKNFAQKVSNANEMSILLAQRRSSTGIKSAKSGSGTVSGSSGGQFDERKHVRSPLDGKFAEKFTSSQLLAARRVVEGAITNLNVGQTVELPNKLGWVRRTPEGYVIQGPAGFYVATKNLSEAVQAAASIIAGKMQVRRGA